MRWLAAAVLSLLTLLAAPQGTLADPVPLAYQVTARLGAVPERILFAVALQESGSDHTGQLLPWPWTLNVAGEARRYNTRKQTCSALMDALSQWPGQRVDVGLCQINIGFHGSRVAHPCDLIDPYQNLQIAATILREQHSQTRDWLRAVERYHRPAGGSIATEYREKVEQHLQRLGRRDQNQRSGGASP